MFFTPKKLNFDFAPYLEADYTKHSGSCIKHQVYELTDIHEKFGGFPKTYCLENTIIHQLWWDRESIDYDDLGKQLGMEVITVSTILQPPGGVIPYHRDMFYQITQRFPERQELKVRANVFMEDYLLGHFIQYTVADETHTALNWQAGDTLMWDSDVLHLGANAGMQNKFTMQISGFLVDVA